MRTAEEKEAFGALLEKNQLSRSSLRSHQALADFNDGIDAKKCVEKAVRDEASARALWVTTALDPWCNKHGLTREQGLSVAFDDGPFNPADPTKDQVTMKSLFDGQQNAFAMHLMWEAREARAKEPPSTDELLLACFQSGDEEAKNPAAVIFKAYRAKPQVMSCSLQRWDVMNGSVPPAENEPTYKAEVSVDRKGGATLNVFPITSSGIKLESPSLLLTLEINEGLPCVHVHTHGQDELQATVFGRSDGTALVRTGDMSFTPDFAATADFISQAGDLPEPGDSPAESRPS